MPNLSDHRALVTGASSGIGAEIARILAQWGCQLTITARRGDRLDQLAESLRTDHGAEVRTVVCDLSAPDGAATLYHDVERAGETIDILVNNAGFGRFEHFATSEWDVQARMIQLNITSLVELTHRFLPAMRARDRRGYILNVSSIGAYQPVPYMACYAATKSFVRDFTEALAYELAGSNVSATSVCPGGTRTEFAEVAGQKLGVIANASMMSAHQVAEISLHAMLGRKRNLVTGVINKVSCFFMRFLPRRTAAWGAVVILGQPETEPDTEARTS